MPSLDFMLVAQFVRILPGVLDILGAGVDTIHARSVPTAHPLGIAARLMFDTTDTPGKQHHLEIVFHGEDKDLLTVRATIITPPRQDNVPVHWKTAASIALPLTLPIPRYGDYLLTLKIDGESVHEIDLRAIPAENGNGDEA